MAAARLEAQLGDTSGLDRLAAAQLLHNEALRSLQRLGQVQGRGTALAREAAQAELLAAADLVQAVRIAAGISPQVEVLECGLCGDSIGEGEEERCSAGGGCTAIFCFSCIRQCVNVLPVAECWRCQTLDFNGFGSGVHHAGLDFGGPGEMGAASFVHNHSFLVAQGETEDGLLARDAARIRGCPFCRQPVSDEHCQRLGVDHPLFAVGDAEAARAMERAMGRAEGLSLVGAVDADLFDQQRRLGMAVWVSVPQGIIPVELGGGDSPTVCELLTAPARLATHRAVRGGTAGNLRMQLRRPAGVSGGPSLEVEWRQVSFHHVAPRIQRRAQSQPRRRGQDTQRGENRRGSSLGAGQRQGRADVRAGRGQRPPLQREGRAVSLNASPAPVGIDAQARAQGGNTVNIAAQTPP